MARYAVKSLDSVYLLDKVMVIIGALGKFGFIVDTVTGDGASENRSVFKSLCTTSFKDLLSSKLKNIPSELLARIPVNFKTAFEHPTFKGVYIFVAGDMPHLVKKIVNAFKRSGNSKKKNNLSF